MASLPLRRENCCFLHFLIYYLISYSTSILIFQILESQDSIIADEQFNDTAILTEYKLPVGQPERKKLCC